MRQRSKLHWSKIVCRPWAIVVYNVEPTLGQRRNAIWVVCGGGVRSILLLPLVARCLETIDVCIWRMFVFMSVVVTCVGVCGKFVV